MNKMNIILIFLGLLALSGAMSLFWKDRNEMDITVLTQESVNDIVQIGTSSDQDMRKILGKPTRTFPSHSECDPRDYTIPYKCDQMWEYEQRKNPLVFVTLDIYFTPAGIVSGYELKDNY